MCGFHLYSLYQKNLTPYFISTIAVWRRNKRATVDGSAAVRRRMVVSTAVWRGTTGEGWIRRLPWLWPPDRTSPGVLHGSSPATASPHLAILHASSLTTTTPDLTSLSSTTAVPDLASPPLRSTPVRSSMTD